MDDYIRAEQGFFHLFRLRPRTDRHATDYANKCMDKKFFKAFLFDTLAAFPHEKQWAFQIHKLALSETEKEKIFENFLDPITHDFISIPILYVTEQAGSQYQELWDLAAYLDYIVGADLGIGGLGDRLNLKKPYGTLQDDCSWQTDRGKWETLVEHILQSVHRLSNPKTLEQISYKNLKTPTQEDLVAFEDAVAKAKQVVIERPQGTLTY